MDQKTAKIVLLSLAATSVMIGAFDAYASSGQPFTWGGAAIAVGAALAGWAMKTPGVLRPELAPLDEPTEVDTSDVLDDGANP